MSNYRIKKHQEYFAGMRVKNWNVHYKNLNPGVWYRIRADGRNERKWADVFASFLERPGVEGTQGLVVGNWHDFDLNDPSTEVIEMLVSTRNKLPNLKALFIGDIISRECEFSWIRQDNITLILMAYPKLEILKIRGSEGLSINISKHENLQSLVIESNGLSINFLKDLMKAEFPKLQRFELWLGYFDIEDFEYVDEEDEVEEDRRYFSLVYETLNPIFTAKKYPLLKHLAFPNCRFSDEIALKLSVSPLLEQLESLDLSFGTIGDDGAKVLIESPKIGNVNMINFYHNYFTEEMINKLAYFRRKTGKTINIGDRQHEDDSRYIAYVE